MSKFTDVLQRSVTNDKLHAEVGSQERFEDQEGLYRIDHKGRMVKSTQDETTHVQLSKHPIEVRLMSNKIVITAVSDPNYTGFVEYKNEADAKLAYMPLNTPANVFSYMRRNYNSDPSAYKWSTILVDEIHHRHLSNVDEANLDAEAATENLEGIESKDFSDMSNTGGGSMPPPSSTPKSPTPPPSGSSATPKPPTNTPPGSAPKTPDKAPAKAPDKAPDKATADKPVTTGAPKPPTPPTPAAKPTTITPPKPAGAPTLPTPAKPITGGSPASPA